MSAKSEKLLSVVDPEGMAKQPFCYPEAEKAVIGSVLIFPELKKHLEGLTSEDFTCPRCLMVFQAIQTLISEDCKTFDIIAVAGVLKAKNLLMEIGGISFLAELSSAVPTAAFIEHYTEILRDFTLRRRMIALFERSIENLGSAGISQTIENVEKEFREIEKRQSNTDVSDLSKTAPQRALDVLRMAHGDLEMPKFLHSGISDLDKMLMMQETDLVIVAARPSMGKTSLLTQMASFLSDEHATAIFSLEMSEKQLIDRLCSQLTGISMSKFRDPKRISLADAERLMLGLRKFHQKKLFVCDKAGLSLSQIRSRCKKIENLKVVMVDYLSLISSDESTAGELREQQVAEVTKGLKQMAKDMNVLVVLLCQLNRMLERRPDKRPLMSDLRESGAVEQDADAIIFIYRDEVYNPKTDDKGVAELIIAKQRNGATGTVRARWFAEQTRFDDLYPDS